MSFQGYVVEVSKNVYVKHYGLIEDIIKLFPTHVLLENGKIRNDVLKIYQIPEVLLED